MAIRDRLKKTFSSKKTASGDSTPTGNSPPRRTDIEYYEPHEIPRPKYRGRVDKQHKESLEAYSFADAFSTLRRKTSQALSGTFSPGGTQAQSRRASWMSRTKSTTSTTTSVGGHEPDGLNLRRKSVAAAGVPAQSQLMENDDDDTDVANAGGVSRKSTIPTIKLEQPAPGTGRVSPRHGNPFTTEELEKAMTAATLKPHPAGITA